MMKQVLPLLLVACAPACNRPPAVLYDTKLIENVEFVRRGESSLCMDLYVPLNGPSLRPAIILYHGGGWVVGDRSYERDLARFLAGMGYTAATASYRLCDDKGPHHPVPVQDALAAVKFLRSRAADYGVDPSRIAVGGESAGGHLAMLVGLTKDPSMYGDDSYPDVSSNVSAIVNIYGPSDLTTLFDQGGFIIRKLGRAYLGGGPKEFPDRYREASPITHARADAPPLLIVQGDRDTVVPFEQARIMEDAMRRAGGRCTLVRVPHGKHGWGLFFDSADNLRTLPAIVHFLARVFPPDDRVSGA